MDLYNQSCSFVHPVVCHIKHGKTFSVGYYTQTFLPKSLICDMLIGAIDLHHFNTSFSWPIFGWGSWGHWKAKPVGFIFWLSSELMCCWSISSETYWYHFRVRFFQSLEITSTLLSASKKINIGMHSGIIDLISFKLDFIMVTSKLYIWMQPGWPLLSSMASGAQESENFCSILETCPSIWMKFGMLLELIGLMKGMLINFQLVWFLFKGKNLGQHEKVNAGSHLDIYEQFLWNVLWW